MKEKSIPDEIEEALARLVEKGKELKQALSELADGPKNPERPYLRLVVPSNDNYVEKLFPDLPDEELGNEVDDFLFGPETDPEIDPDPEMGQEGDFRTETVNPIIIPHPRQTEQSAPRRKGKWVVVYSARWVAAVVLMIPTFFVLCFVFITNKAAIETRYIESALEIVDTYLEWRQKDVVGFHQSVVKEFDESQTLKAERLSIAEMERALEVHRLQMTGLRILSETRTNARYRLLGSVPDWCDEIIMFITWCYGIILWLAVGVLIASRNIRHEVLVVRESRPPGYYLYER